MVEYNREVLIFYLYKIMIVKHTAVVYQQHNVTKLKEMPHLRTS